MSTCDHLRQEVDRTHDPLSQQNNAVDTAEGGHPGSLPTFSQGGDSMGNSSGGNIEATAGNTRKATIAILCFPMYLCVVPCGPFH